MIVTQYMYPHCLEVEGNVITIYNKLGLPISKPLRIKRLGDRKLTQLAYSRDGIVRNNEGKITEIYLFEKNEDVEKADFLFRMKLLGNLQINQL